MTDSPATRQSLLVRLKDPKDGQAWGEFVAIYAPLIDRLARAKGFQEADAADLAQDVFRAVAGAIDRYDPDPARGSFRGWLFRIARNLMINLLAARRIRPQATGDSDVREIARPRPGARLGRNGPVRRRVPPQALPLGSRAGPRRVPRLHLEGLLADRGRGARARGRGGGRRDLGRRGLHRQEPGHGPAAGGDRRR